MYKQTTKTTENQRISAANSVAQKQEHKTQGFGFVDNRPAAVTQRKMQRMVRKSNSVQKTQSSAPIQRKPDAVFENDRSRRNKGLQEVKGLNLFAGTQSGTTVTPGGKKVKTKSGGKFSALEEKLKHSQLSRDLTQTGAEHDVHIGQAQQEKDDKGLEVAEFFKEHNKNKPGDKTSDAYKTWLSDKKAKIDENKLSGDKLTAAQANKRAALKAKEDEKPHLKNSARLSWVDRHKAVDKAAKAANPLMKTIMSGGDLSSTHERNATAREQDGTLKGTRSFEPDGTRAKMESGAPLSIVGADEFLNDPGSADRGAPVLPELTKSNTGSRNHTDALKSTVGAWGEADVNRLNGKERDADRLLHTKPKSKVKSKNNTKAKKVDSQFYLSVDHYESAMPISPVETNYTRKKKPLYDVKPGGPSSLEQYDKQETQKRLKAKIRAKRRAFRAARKSKR